ncbi:peptidase [Chitinimonas arctica]|uniref:microbial collagenase n=1 Tax=Chitinimonas arctica TaxID=2594795 RepID=A0A516SBG6_9NEIS|nr:M9 family metallopeptidase [Chitinimonas arctica]QDQ25408.1 peptidase [Chitinimonas arctica]
MNYRLHARGQLAIALALAFSTVHGAIPPSPPTQQAVDPSTRHSVVGTATQPVLKPVTADIANPDMARSRALQHAMADTTPCRVEDFGAVKGDALVSLVKSQTTSCIGKLYTVTGGTARAALNEAQMISIAGALRQAAQGYDGTNRNQIQQLVAYLRAGYFVQWYHKSDVGDYGQGLKTAIRAALDALYANDSLRKVNSENGDLLSEAVTLIDSAGENARYLPVVLDLLKRADDSYFKNWSMRNAVNNVFTVLFRGHQNDDFAALVRNDTKVVDALDKFYRQRLSLRGTDSEFVLVNAVREAGRFMKYSERKEQVKPLLRTVLLENEMVGKGAGLWLASASMADYYDAANCNYYNTCNFKVTLKSKVLSKRYDCSPSLKILAQDMNTEQFKQSCALIGAEEKLFHYGMFGGDPQASKPVPNDKNSALEVVVFDDYQNYATYASVLFGIDTNNGGMYLEGNPADANNQARFIAHEASWNRPAFQVWNLEHEFIHYLDGRYDLEGDFGRSNAVNSVWWGEGVAEYYSHQNNYPEAITEGRRKTYALSTIFGNKYDMGDYTNRAYRWGYLAVRFMFEKHRADVEKALSLTRSGDYAGYTSHMNSLGSRYDAEFAKWLETVGDSGEFAGGKPAGSTGGNTAPTVTGLADQRIISGQSATLAFTVADKETPAAQLSVAIASSNPAMFPATSMILGGSGGQRSLKLQPRAGQLGTAQLTVTVSDGKLSASGSFTVTVSGDGGGGGGNCPARSDALADGCTRVVSGTGAAYYYINVPAGTRQLRLSTGGGSGDADLYVQDGKGWPTESSYVAKSVQAGNSETVLIEKPVAGYYHLMLKPKSPFANVKLSAAFNGAGGGDGDYSESKCPANPQGLSDYCLRGNLSGERGFFWVYAPANAKRITLSTEGGNELALFAKTGTWPSTSDYQYRSAAGSQNLVLDDLQGGNRYYHVLLQGKSPYQGVKLKARVE